MFDIVGLITRSVGGDTEPAAPETETQPPAPQAALHECPACETVFIEPGFEECRSCDTALEEVSGTL